MERKTVVIDASGNASPEDVDLNTFQEDEVVWVSDSGRPMMISFDSGAPEPNSRTEWSPFLSATFTLPANGWVSSSRLKNGVAVGVYKYSIRDAKGGLLTDPRVKVKH